ncbi:MAG TPA: hypothetical protein VEB60_02415 [Candidatus Paceibacterota bacterium]|nr:hypothetical protein [Candidatus Paceibacterota bacterium]
MENGNNTIEREHFNEAVYSTLQEAKNALLERRDNQDIKEPDFLPEVLRSEPYAVIFRHIATPNYELRRFISSAELAGLKPLILEYTEDRFTSLNEWKRSLGKICLHQEPDGLSHPRSENKSVIDFNDNNGKPISQAKTLWGQSLTEFHHELFLKSFPGLANNIFDLSDWVKQNGSDPKTYYKRFLSLFIKNGILFENFLLNQEEINFTKNVILSALEEIKEETGLKPLIVPLEPIDIECEKFWLCHPLTEKEYITERIKQGK